MRQNQYETPEEGQTESERERDIERGGGMRTESDKYITVRRTYRQTDRNTGRQTGGDRKTRTVPLLR